MSIKKENIYRLLEISLSKNTKLNNEEKEYFKMMEKSIVDNYDKINLTRYLKILESIYIVYEENNIKSGEYYFLENYIIFYGGKKIQDIPTCIVTHELFHLQEPDLVSNGAFSEAINAIFNNKYFGKANELYDNSYSLVVNYMYDLAKIIGFESLEIFHFTSDINVIKKALYDIIPDSFIINRFIETINVFYLSNNLNDLEKDNNLNREIESYLNQFYNKKYNQNN
ncbi:MAG: hypothetical protein NC483_00080 [Ruminococcus sp.]|nr:hypothetical protein [Ruminococcus sp.]